MATPPLAHLRVVDCTDLRGALAGRILADLGADVVKIEPPAGDPDRLRPPFAADVTASDRSLPFLFRHANKRGLVLEIESDDGFDRLVALLERADVLLENRPANDVLRRRLSGSAIGERLPHLVHASVTDFGLAGPRADWRLEALPAFAASGALFASGAPDRPPCWLPGYVAHDCASILALCGVLAALRERAHSGRGDTIEVSVQEAALAGLDPWSVPLADYARAHPFLPAAWPRDADGPAVVLPTRDGFVRVLPITPRHWRAFAALVAGRAPPESDAAARAAHPTRESVGGAAGRAAGRSLLGAVRSVLDQTEIWAGRAALRLAPRESFLPALHAALAGIHRAAGAAFARRSREDVLASARRLGLPITPVHTLEGFVASEQTQARGFFLRTGFPRLGAAPFAPFPARLAATPVAVSRPPPPPPDPAAKPASAEEVASIFPTRERIESATVRAGPPLDRVRVVSLGVGAVVPGLCRTLAELGARIVKIESRAHPDFLRRLTCAPGDPDQSLPFNDENRGQRSVCLDLTTPRGRELALALCARADVVAENHQSGFVARFGLDAESVQRVNPNVVYLSSQGYGEGGPLAREPAFGPLNAAFAGLVHLWGHARAPRPTGSHLEHPDHVAGHLAVVAVLAALEHRRLTGEGQRIELAQTEAAAFLLGERYLEQPCTGRPAAPQGNAVDYACPHGVYPAAGDDRWIAIAVVGDDAWQRFRAALGWKRAPALEALAGRLADRRRLDTRLAAWTRRRDAEEAAATLQAAGVSAMPVVGPLEQRADSHLAARRALVVLADPQIGPARHVAPVVRFARSALPRPAPAPRLGADTRAVLERELGLSRAAIARLVREGVCG